MDQRRLIILLVFSFSLIMLWDAWMRDQRSSEAPDDRPAETAQVENGDEDVPSPSGRLSREASEEASVPVDAEAEIAAVEYAQVTTDRIVARVSSQGGQIVRLELKEHASSAKDGNFILFDDGARHFYATQSGLIGEGMPNHRTRYQLSDTDLTLEDGQDSVTLRLDAPEQNGVQVSKLMTFHRGSYLIDVDYEINNVSDRNLDSHAYFQFARDGEEAESVQVFGVRTFTGPAVYTDENKFEKIDFDDIADGSARFTKQAPDGWLAMVQHYFVGAWLPEHNTEREYYARQVGPDLYTAGIILPVGQIAAGDSGRVGVELYAGPQEQDYLSSIAEGLGLVVDYGWLTMIAAPLFWVLSWIHGLVGNWGWAIILLTVLIKLVFFPLSAASYKSMAKMRVLAPRMQRLKELYGDDKQRMQQEVMKMYRTEKINPLGGCLPILVQIPVFIALYWVLLGSVEVRHAPWILWIQDLSARDPYFILPLLMGASMFVQMKLNPAPPDPMQAKIMMALPVVFTVMFLFFPSGLVLYWVVNNVLSIAQQWYITRNIEAGKEKAKAGASSG